MKTPPRFCFWLGLVLSGATVAHAADTSAPLTRAIDIRALSADEATQGRPVQLRATVTFNGTPGSIFVQDETAGASFRLNQREPVQPGEILEITGRTRVGYYLPGIDAARYRVVGRGPLPVAVAASYDDLISGHFHYQRVAIEGIARSESAFEGGRRLLRVAMGNRIVEVRVEDGSPPERSLVDTRVRVEGLAAGSINSRRQLVQPFLRVLDWTAVTVLEPTVAEAMVPRISASELLTFRPAGQGNHRVRIGGVVTAALANRAFVRQEKTAFEIRFHETTPLAVGDEVEILGFAQLERFSASVVDAQLVRKVAGGGPLPIEASIAELLAGAHDSDLVAVTAQVTDSFRVGSDLMLTLQADGRAVQARVPDAAVDVARGATVRIVGICQVETSVESGYNAKPETISLRLRTPDDVRVLQLPPWWTVRRLLAALALLAGVVGLAALWIFLLRGQVRRQTAALRESLQSEAALQERHRIAREFHDTLEQDLAGLGLRLDAAGRRVHDEKGRDLLRTARALVSRIQVETRDLIGDLRNSTEQAGDLAGTLQALAERTNEGAGAPVGVAITSSPPRLPPATVHHLRMIAAECIANARKHAQATAIDVRVTVAGDRLRLTMVDDGRGFDATGETQGKPGHFGCIGIRERCRKLGAEVTWTSAPGRGVTVVVELPVESGNASTGEHAPLAI